jgi:hypothetical protein
MPLIGFGQAVSDSTAQSDTTFTLKDDTLFSSKGFNICVGQKFIIGKGSGEEGRYQSISFKSPLAFPLIFLRKTQIESNTDYQDNPSDFDQDQVKASLIPGQLLIVKKIKLIGHVRKWHIYRVYLYDDTPSWRYKYICDIETALKWNELLIK